MMEKRLTIVLVEKLIAHKGVEEKTDPNHSNKRFHRHEHAIQTAGVAILFSPLLRVLECAQRNQ